MDIQRYDLDEDQSGHACMTKDDDGLYVWWADVRAENKKLLAVYEAAQIVMYYPNIRTHIGSELSQVMDNAISACVQTRREPEESK